MQEEQKDHQKPRGIPWCRVIVLVVPVCLVIVLVVLLAFVLSSTFGSTSRPIKTTSVQEKELPQAEGLSLAIDQAAINSGIRVRARIEDKVPTLPPSMAAVSLFYSFEVQGKPETAARVTVPLREKLQAEDIADAYRYYEGKWQWIGPASVSKDGKSAIADSSVIPANFIVVRPTDSSPRIAARLPRQAKLSPKANGLVDLLHPDGYSVRMDGSVVGEIQKPPDSGKYSLAPVIRGGAQGGASNPLDTILRSDSLRERHAAAILDLVKSKSFDGIDLDYQGIDTLLRDQWTGFVADLATRLHRENRTLALTLPPPTEVRGKLDTGAYDWRELGRHADYIRLTGEKDQTLYAKRMNEALALAAQQVDRRKIYLVLSTYSHERSKNGISEIAMSQALQMLGQIEIAGSSPSASGRTVALVAPRLANERGSTGPFWNEETNTLTFIYPASEGSRVLWLENSFSISHKLQVLNRLRLGGIVLDGLGDDIAEAGLWPLLSTIKTKGFREVVKPNESRFEGSWEAVAGDITDQGSGRATWVVPDTAGPLEVRLIVGDGESRYASRLVINLSDFRASSGPRSAPTRSPGRASPLPVSEPGGPKYPGVGFGMCIDAGNDFPRALRVLRNAKADWAKVQVRWQDVEPQRGRINWEYIDSIVNTAQAHGARLLLSIVTAPNWSRPADADFNFPGPPANPQDYADFVGAIASRHPRKVQAYEIWNEENVNYEWGGPGRLNATQYLELLKAAYQRIKAIDPETVVLSGGLTPTGVNDGYIAYDDVVFMRQMYEAGLKDYSDAVAVHANVVGHNAPDEEPNPDAGGRKGHWSFFFRRFEQIRDIMVEFGDADKQIWFTEFGWPSSADTWPDYAPGEVSEDEQAQWLRRGFEIAREKGYVGPMMIWNLNYASVAEPNDRWGKAAYAILSRTWNTRPAYLALAAMTR
ncbi:MAG: hypothetical protein HYX92_01865 [Chloroflexi bacterium]|nr:hypothetical protein [Chloroflexota bacterium]